MTKIVHKTQHCNQNNILSYSYGNDEHATSEALSAIELGFHVNARGLVIESQESWDGVLES